MVVADDEKMQPAEVARLQNKRWRRRSVLAAALVAVWVGMMDDPLLGFGPLGKFAAKYDPLPHQLASYDDVMGSWPFDKGSRLGQGAVLHSKGLIHGPESLEFGPDGQGPYTGLADGRLVRWDPHTATWHPFALASPTWNSSCIEPKDHKDEDYDNKQKKKRKKKDKKWKRNENLCGRPLGLRFHKKDNHIYFADSYYGLLRVGPEGGQANLLTSRVGKNKLLFANDLDIHKNGSIFFTDSSTRHNRLHHQRILLETENTGRLLRYDVGTGQTSVVLTGLCFPNGVQLSQDQSFLLITETTNCRVLRYWLQGPKTGQLEVFANLPGFPDNIRMNEKGQFWVAIDCCRTRLQEIFSSRPWLRRIFFKSPFPIRVLYKIVGMRMFTMITLFDHNGHIVDSLEDTHGDVVKLVSEVQEKNGTLWIGTVHHKHIALFQYDPTS